MPYETIEEAIEIANGTSYALGASVFGASKYQCLDVARQLQCGMVAINDFGVFYVCPRLILHRMISSDRVSRLATVKVSFLFFMIVGEDIVANISAVKIFRSAASKVAVTGDSVRAAFFPRYLCILM